MYRCSVYIIFFDVDMWIGQICYSDSVHKSGEVLLRSVCGQAATAGWYRRMDGRRQTNKRTNGRTKELLSIFQLELWSSCSSSPATYPEEKVYLSSLTFLWWTLRDFEKRLLSSIDSHFRDKSRYFIYSLTSADNVENDTCPRQLGIRRIKINLKLVEDKERTSDL